MIIPLICGYVIGKLVPRKSIIIFLGVVLGLVIGINATLYDTLVLYPFFSGETGLIVVPEFRIIGIMFLVQDWVLYSETIYMLTRSNIIDVFFITIGILGTLIGSWLSSKSRFVDNTVFPESQ